MKKLSKTSKYYIIIGLIFLLLGIVFISKDYKFISIFPFSFAFICLYTVITLPEEVKYKRVFRL
jgi:Zn-dependent membrane protease YugP